MRRVLMVASVSLLVAACAGTASTTLPSESGPTEARESASPPAAVCAERQQAIDSAFTEAQAQNNFAIAKGLGCTPTRPDPATNYEERAAEAEAEREAEANRCAEWQDRVYDAATLARALKLRDKAIAQGCALPVPKGHQYDRPSSAGGVNKSNGIAWKWAPNPNCDYFACYGMTIKAVDQACPNNVYVEINLLDAQGNVVGYSNDTVGALMLGQKAKLVFDVTDDGVKRAQLNEISCY